MHHAVLPDSLVALLLRQHGVVTRGQIHMLNLSDSALRGWLLRSLLTRIQSGAYADADIWEHADARQRLLLRLLATQLAAPDAIAFGVTAAVVNVLPVRALPARPQLARTCGAPRPAHCSVRRTTIPIEHTINRGGIVTTTIERTVIDVAATQPLPDALITVDAALRGGVDPDALKALLVGLGHFPGSVQAKATLLHGDPRCESPMESLSRGHMIERRMPLPQCNVVIRFGNRWVRVDFLWLELGVVGECDGKVKYTQLDERGDAIWREKRRAEWLEDLGFEIARWGYPEIADGGAVMQQRFERAATRQRQYNWTLADRVTVETPMEDSCRFGPLWTPKIDTDPPFAAKLR